MRCTKYFVQEAGCEESGYVLCGKTQLSMSMALVQKYVHVDISYEEH